MIFFSLLIAIIVLLARRAWKHRRFYQRPVVDVIDENCINRRNRRKIARGEAEAVIHNKEVIMRRKYWR